MGITKLNAGRKKEESRRSHGAAARDRHAGNLLVGYESYGEI